MFNENEVIHKLTAWQQKKEFWMPRAVFSPGLSLWDKASIRRVLKSTEDYWEMSPAEKKAFRVQLSIIDKFLEKKILPPHVEVRFCQSIQGKGLYAAIDIEKGSFIGLYGGIVVADSETVDGNRYLFGIGEGYSIDAAECGNYTRAINNTIGRYANAAAYKIKLPGEVPAQVAFFASKKIKKGKQILFSYGKQYFRALKIKPLILTPDSL